MSRYIGVDFGHARIGIAISDEKGCIASPLSIVKGNKNPSIAAKNVALMLEEEVQKRNICFKQIVVGLPLHMNGSESPRSKEARSFAQTLEELLQIPVTLFDERLTTLQADRSLKEYQLSRKKRSAHLDSVASTILLQSFLDLQATQQQ